ncbi:alpha/beta fold hydrolase [Corallococcus sp. M34]|uniref:alpha/beta fold hydrolase n=1 Tax=Citreicoccus inhibens TaxID=2849499 RepID=UPI001C23CB4B|nr:alpha/beta fold hydrolase [Citreicoccus inhibens]MBU8899111.1 alpha/beta fold hydrolase [Citreicoccus inhibens]
MQTETSQSPSIPQPLRVLAAGLATAIPAVLVTTVAVHTAPHVQGIGFFPSLRYAVLTPVSVAIALAAAMLYRLLISRSARPRAVLGSVLAGLGLVTVSALALAGPTGLVSAALPAVAVGALALAWLTPRAVQRPARSRISLTLLLLLGALEGWAFLAASAHEPALPKGSPVAFDVPSELFDAAPQFVTLPSGARIHYVDEGTGPTLLFLHGNPAWSFQWRTLIQGLRGSYRTIALDYPGFGMSEAPAGYGFTPREQSHVVEEFVEQLRLHDVTLVMQDWGGPIGLGFATRRPELVQRIILGSTWAWPTQKNVPRGIFSVIAGGPVGEFFQMNFNGFASFGLQNGIVRKLAPQELDTYLRPFVPLERRGIAAFYPRQITAATDYFTEVESALPRLANKDALIFWALKDEGFPREDLEHFQRVFPRNRTREFAEANHFFFEDTAPQMLPEIKAFLSAPISSR